MELTLKSRIWVAFVFQFFIFFRNSETLRSNYRLCVPESSKLLCEQMVNDVNLKGGKISCILGSGKIGCIEKIIKNDADFIPLEPEQIYTAQKFRRNSFNVIGEVRSQEFKNRDYRYEAVVVTRKSSGIQTVSDLRGKRSCHTGFGRNAGWKIPFSYLLDLGELTELCNLAVGSTPERDLFAISKYFSDVCAVGSWVPEKNYDTALRYKFSNLCSLCKDPAQCNGNDTYSGYEGALKCLTENNADVAWTKMDAVKKFFKLGTSSPLAIIKDYEFLCLDGTKRPLTWPDQCPWAKRPWRAILASVRLNFDEIKDLQAQLQLYLAEALQIRQTQAEPKWDIQILEIDSTKDSFEVYSPQKAKTIVPYEYLHYNNYSVTIDKPSCSNSKVIRICVRNILERMKCSELQLGAEGQRILPNFECVTPSISATCFQKVQSGDADVVIATPKEANNAMKNHGLISILSAMDVIDEPSQEKATFKYAVAVIRNDSGIRNLTDLRGKKSCHGSIRSLAGWNIPLSVLRSEGVISGPSCSLSVELSKFFNASCIPGALRERVTKPWLSESLCAVCRGDSIEGGVPTQGTVCSNGPAERYFGNLGALRCLADQVADIAFVDHVGVLQDSPGIIDLDSIRLLCPNGAVMDTTEFRLCNWGRVPTLQVMVRDGDANAAMREDAKLSLLKAGDAFSPYRSFKIMKLFGSYYSNKNVIFQDTSVGLANFVEDSKTQELIDSFDFCTTSSAMSAFSSNGYQIWFPAILFVVYFFKR